MIDRDDGPKTPGARGGGHGGEESIKVGDRGLRSRWREGGAGGQGSQAGHAAQYQVSSREYKGRPAYNTGARVVKLICTASLYQPKLIYTASFYQPKSSSIKTQNMLFSMKH